MISSRKEENVEQAIKSLKSENLSVTGMVCHVSNAQHRKSLIQKVKSYYYSLLIYLDICHFLWLTD